MDFFQSTLQCHSIDNSCQHAHVIALRSVNHTTLNTLHTSENIATTYHHGNFYT